MEGLFSKRLMTGCHTHIKMWPFYCMFNGHIFRKLLETWIPANPGFMDVAAFSMEFFAFLKLFQWSFFFTAFLKYHRILLKRMFHFLRFFLCFYNNYPQYFLHSRGLLFLRFFRQFLSLPDRLFYYRREHQ